MADARPTLSARKGANEPSEAVPVGFDAVGGAKWTDLAAELTAAVEGEVRFDWGSRALYAYDASVYRQVPIGVVVPASLDDVVQTVAICRRHGAPVLSRGCGTSVAGQCVNLAVVIDYSKELNRILELDVEGRRARVQPGVICDELRDAAEEHGLTFGPDPSTHDHCTLGGMIGNNSCGTHALMAGKTVDNIESMEVLLYDGTRMTVGPTGDEELQSIIARGGRQGEIYAGLQRIAERYGDRVRAEFPDIPRRVSGYNLDDLLADKGFNVARALVGSEGTCVAVLEATVRLVPSPPKRSLAVLGFPDMPSAGHAVPRLLSYGPIGLEFFDGKVVGRLETKGVDLGGETLLPEGECWLLVEFGGETQEDAEAPAAKLGQDLEGDDGAPSFKLYDDAAQETAVWEVRRHSVGASRMPAKLGGDPGWPNWEDAAVAPERLGDYLADQLHLLGRYGYDGMFYGHFGQGCVHCRIDFDLRSAAGVRTFRSFMEESADLVVSYGGSLSGEHGDGHGRAELWPKMFGPEVMAAFAEFKGLWDPDNKMNPGKLVDPYRLDEHLREGAGYRPVPVRTHFGFPEDAGDFAEAVGRCFGVGKCRHVDAGTMCPSFMVTREERHSTRGRSRLLYEMLRETGDPVAGGWRNRDVKDALDLCLACKGCKGDCPVKVDMATYKAEFLSHYYRGRLRPASAYAMGLIPVWARLAGLSPTLVNAVAQHPRLSPTLKSLGGIAPEREVPRFGRQSFTSWFRRHRPVHPEGAPVLLFADTFNNYFHPETAVAATEVLEAAGRRVVVPSPWLCCGRPLYDYGMLDLAKRLLRRVVDQLHPHIAAGVPMVVLEPSCAAVFRDELTNLLPRDQGARRLHDQTFVLSELLRDHCDGFRPPALSGKALVQAHCHHKAILGVDAQQDLLEGMGLEVEVPDSGCCGMAGSFGFERGEHYAVSMAAGERVILPKVREASADTVVVAAGFSCREQIAQATDRRALHPAEVVRLAMGQGPTGPPGRPELARQ